MSASVIPDASNSFFRHICKVNNIILIISCQDFFELFHRTHLLNIYIPISSFPLFFHHSANFFIGPGQSAIQADEILAEIIIPSRPVTPGIYLKYSTRPMDVAIVSLAVVMAKTDGEVCEKIVIALGAVGPTPFRARKAESVMRGERLGGDIQGLIRETAEKAVEESQPIDDFRASAAHRKKMIQELMTEGLKQTIGMKGPKKK